MAVFGTPDSLLRELEAIVNHHALGVPELPRPETQIEASTVLCVRCKRVFPLLVTIEDMDESEFISSGVIAPMIMVCLGCKELMHV